MICGVLFFLLLRIWGLIETVKWQPMHFLKGPNICFILIFYDFVNLEHFLRVGKFWVDDDLLDIFFFNDIIYLISY